MRINQIGMYEDQEGRVWHVVELGHTSACAINKDGACRYFLRATGEAKWESEYIVAYHVPEVKRHEDHGEYTPVESLEQEVFTGEAYETKAEAMNQEGAVAVGRLHAPLLGDLVDVDLMLEDAACRASELAGEIGEEGCPTTAPDDAKRELVRLIDAWAERHGLQPDFRLVEIM